MRVIPVLDLLDGIVVRGVAGERSQYRPVESCLVNSAQPIAVARAFRERLGLEAIYVADLDAILHNRPNLACYEELQQDGFRLLVDAGVRGRDDLLRLESLNVESIILGLETCPSPDFLTELAAGSVRDRLIFSLDMKAGTPLTSGEAWQGMSPLDIAETVVATGIRQLILLDLAQVGVAQGVSTLPLCSELLARHPDIRIITGGGVRNGADLESLAAADIFGVLVASALHSGQIPADTIATLKKK